MMCDGTWTNGAAASIAARITSRSGRCSSASSLQKLSAALRYWACWISSSSWSRDTAACATSPEVECTSAGSRSDLVCLQVDPDRTEDPVRGAPQLVGSDAIKGDFPRLVPARKLPVLDPVGLGVREILDRDLQ